MAVRESTGLDAEAETDQGPHGSTPSRGGGGGPGIPTQAEKALVQGLGWFSIGLGAAELLRAGDVARLSGIEQRPVLLRLFGLREIASGLAILLGARKDVGLWSRVAGDALDLGLVGQSWLTGNASPRRTAVAAAALGGVTALDLFAAARATRRAAQPTMFRAIRSIAINRSPEECFTFWRNLSNLPFFMEGVESVTELDERRSCWVAQGPGGKRVEWEAEITREEPHSLIFWRSLPGGDIETAGSILFQPRPGAHGTMVRVAMEWRPPAGAIGESLARLSMASPAQQLKEDLRRMKAILETGEVPTTEGQASGRRGLGHRALTRWLTGGAA